MSDGIKIVTFTSKETEEYRQKKYVEFLKYYFDTDLKISDIFKCVGLNSKNSTMKYIRKRLKSEGYNTYLRGWSIRKGEWLK